MADCAAIKTRLDAAQAALDSAITGGAVRVVQDSDNSRVEYTAANTSKLVSYIALLQAQYDACVAGTTPVVARPVSYLF